MDAYNLIMKQQNKYIYVILLMPLLFSCLLLANKKLFSEGNITDQKTIESVLINKKNNFDFFNQLRKNNHIFYERLREYHSFKDSGRDDLLNKFLHIEFKEKVTKFYELDHFEIHNYEYNKSLITSNYAKLFSDVIHTMTSGVISKWHTYEYWAYSEEDENWYLLDDHSNGVKNDNYINKIEEYIKNNLDHQVIK